MCTLTWFTTDNGYQLFFNRDEQRTRRRAELPRLHTDAGISYLSPTDSDAGGTWIATNQFGVTVCLLNHYQFEQIATYKQWISRGDIVRKFATIESLAQAEQLFAQLSLDDYRAFRLFAIDKSGSNVLWIWDGHQPRVESDVSKPKSSSSVDAMQVKQQRKALFFDLGLNDSKNPEEYIQYHKSHIPGPSKESVCLHRDDAKTVSLSHVEVAGTEVGFRYYDGSPCETEPEPLVTMALKSHS